MRTAVLFVLVILLFISVTFGIMLGSVSVEPEVIWKIAFSNVPWLGDLIIPDWTKSQGHIIWDIRFPRVLLGAVVGMGLAVVGVAIQALVRNPLADPYILGVSSGASVGAVSVIIFGAFGFFGQYALSFTAFLGALFAVLFVLFTSRVGGRISNVRLVLAGIAVSMILSAVTSFMIMSAPQEEGIRAVMFWMMGSLAGAKWDSLFIPAITVVSGMMVLSFQSRSLNILLIGEKTAATLGIHIEWFRKFLILLTALITGVIVAVSGAIGFVGLMVPHVVRLIVGSDHRYVLPVSALCGAIFMVWADVCARLVVAPQELPIGIVTALCGGPFFIWLMRRRSYSFGEVN